MKIEIKYKEIIKRSWDLTLKNKWLWVYGITLSIFSGRSGSGGGGSNGGGSSSKLPDKLPEDFPLKLPEKGSDVLGVASGVLDQAEGWFVSISILTWVLIGLGFLMAVIFFVLMAWVARSWAKSGLIYGMYWANKDKKVTLANTSPYALGKVKQMILLALMSFLMFILAFSLVAVLIGVSILLAEFVHAIFYLLLVLVMLLMIFLILVLAMLGIYAERLVVLKNYSPWEAWKKALKLSKKYLFPTIRMGCFNQLIGCGFGCVGMILLGALLAAPGAAIFLPMFKTGFSVGKVLGGVASMGVFLLLFIWGSYLLNAVLAVFKVGTWNLFFEKIIMHEEKKDE